MWRWKTGVTLGYHNPNVTWLGLPSNSSRLFLGPCVTFPPNFLHKSVEQFLRNPANKQTNKQTPMKTLPPWRRQRTVINGLSSNWWCVVWRVYMFRAIEYAVQVENNLSAIRTVRVLRPLRAINRIPSNSANSFFFVSQKSVYRDQHAVHAEVSPVQSARSSRCGIVFKRVHFYMASHVSFQGAGPWRLHFFFGGGEVLHAEHTAWETVTKFCTMIKLDDERNTLQGRSCPCSGQNFWWHECWRAICLRWLTFLLKLCLHNGLRHYRRLSPFFRAINSSSFCVYFAGFKVTFCTRMTMHYGITN